MAQSASTRFPGCPHHVTQRGRGRRDVFLVDEDRLDFLELLGRAAQSEGVVIWAYVLMTNHVHLIAVPEDRRSLSDAMRHCQAAYTRAFETRHGSAEALWEERHYASAIAPRYLWEAVRYVERNPVRARMVPRAEAYRWSSAPYHCGVRTRDPLVSSASPLVGALDDWSAWLREPDGDRRLSFLRWQASNRRQASPSECISVFDHRLDRRIAAWKKAAKAKAKAKAAMRRSRGGGSSG